jgi:hypothetical protein
MAILARADGARSGAGPADADSAALGHGPLGLANNRRETTTIVARANGH